MTIMTETNTSDNFGWADPNSSNYRPEIVQLIKNVAATKSLWARNVIATEVDAEDIISELYVYLFSDPKLLQDSKIPSKILHNRAITYCFKVRSDKGAAMLGTDQLHEILINWETIPQYILDFLYGTSFPNAGEPAGSYLDAIETHYKYKQKVMKRNLLSRSLERLAQIIDGVMVGSPDSFSRIELNPNVPSYTDSHFADEIGEDPDPTFKPYSAMYGCLGGHLYMVNFPKKPKGYRIGTKTEYGFRYCKCGELLELCTPE